MRSTGGDASLPARVKREAAEAKAEEQRRARLRRFEDVEPEVADAQSSIPAAVSESCARTKSVEKSLALPFASAKRVSGSALRSGSIQSQTSSLPDWKSTRATR